MEALDAFLHRAHHCYPKDTAITRYLAERVSPLLAPTPDTMAFVAEVAAAAADEQEPAQAAPASSREQGEDRVAPSTARTTSAGSSSSSPPLEEGAPTPVSSLSVATDEAMPQVQPEADPAARLLSLGTRLFQVRVCRGVRVLGSGFF